MNTTDNFLFRMMEENQLHARLAEEKRATIAHMILIAATAIQISLPFVGLAKKTLPITVWLILLGIYGIATSLKLYERSQFHILRARKLRARLDELYPDAHVATLQKQAESEHAIRYQRLMNIRLNSIWLGFYVLIVILGIVYTTVSLR